MLVFVESNNIHCVVRTSFYIAGVHDQFCPFYHLFNHSVAAPHLCHKFGFEKGFLQNLSLGYINHKRSDKLRVSDTQRVGRWFGEVHTKLLWVVCARAGIGKGIIRPLRPTL